jgi:hypothetical protein
MTTVNYQGDRTMKHLAQIAVEFLKTAANSQFPGRPVTSSWDSLSYKAQRQYLKEHPKSKKRITKKQDTSLAAEPADVSKREKLAKDIYAVLAERVQRGAEKEKEKFIDPDDIYDSRFFKDADPKRVKEATEEISQWIEDEYELGEKELKLAEEMADDWDNREPENLDGFIDNFS